MTNTKKLKAKMPGDYQCHPKIKAGKRGCLPTKVYSLFGGKTRHAVKKKTGCSTDRCIAEKANLPSVFINKYLRPKKPASWKTKPDTWLDTNNIDEVMKQYEEAFPHFIYLGAVPIDFSAQDPTVIGQKKCLYSSFCKINLVDMKGHGKTAIGAVFNLDPHFKNGSHWVALFIDLNNNECNFFDSYGMRPHPLIFHLMKSLTLQIPDLRLNYNARRFQHGNSECGMYSLYFLINMIEGVRFKQFVKRPVRDEQMLRLRNWIFSD